LFVTQISQEPLNGFAPNYQKRRILSLARMSFKVKVKGERSRSPETKNALGAAVTPRQRMNGIRSLQTAYTAAVDATIRSLTGVISGACVRCMFRKTSLALVLVLFRYRGFQSGE